MAGDPQERLVPVEVDQRKLWLPIGDDPSALGRIGGRPGHESAMAERGRDEVPEGLAHHQKGSRTGRVGRPGRATPRALECTHRPGLRPESGLVMTRTHACQAVGVPRKRYPFPATVPMKRGRRGSSFSFSRRFLM